MYISDRWLMHSKNDYKYMYLNILKVKLMKGKTCFWIMLPEWSPFECAIIFFFASYLPVTCQQTKRSIKLSKVLAYGCSCRKMKQPGTCRFTWCRWSFQYLDKTADSACIPISEAMLIWGGQIISVIFLKDHCQPFSKMVIVEALFSLFWFIFIIGLIHVTSL